MSRDTRGPVVIYRDPGGVEVRTPLGVMSSARLEPGLAEIDAAVAAFARVGVPVKPAFVLVQPMLGRTPAIYVGGGEVLAGWADPPFLPGLPVALGDLALERGAVRADVCRAIAAAGEAVDGLYVRARYGAA